MNFFRLAQEELATLAGLAELSVKRPQDSTECLDLDEMFSFLSDIQDSKTQAQDFISDIGLELDAVMKDLEVNFSIFKLNYLLVLKNNN